MSGRERLVLQSIATLLGVAAIGLGLWWMSSGSGSFTSADRAGVVPSTAVADGAAAGRTDGAVAGDGATGDDAQDPATAPATALPTSTPPPTATPVPVPRPFTELIQRIDLVDQVQSPLPGCTLHGGELSIAGTIAVRCIEDWASVDVQAVAPGRIVHINRSPAVDVSDLLVGGVAAGQWSWTAQAAIGPHVVVDHGTFAGSRNMQTVYAGLDVITDGLALGQPVEVGTVLGSLTTAPFALQFSLWDANMRQDGAVTVEPGPDLERQRAAAAALGSFISSPTDPLCPLSLGGTQLPGAPRAYRNGTHQGIDFGCGTSDRFGTAIADGTVVYLVDDYADPTVADREALLFNAGVAGFTPHWTLVMLYGNVVIVDHGEVPGAGRIYTIAAHLESVDPAITLGAEVVAGQRLGELGNRGTNAAALGLRGAQDPSLHLHWELFIDRWYLGSGQSPVAVEELITTTLCGAAQTAGCPA